jgi:hypothetical protein
MRVRSRRPVNDGWTRLVAIAVTAFLSGAITHAVLSPVDPEQEVEERPADVPRRSTTAAPSEPMDAPRLEDGVPARFARTEAGAVAAAAAFVCTGQVLLDMDPIGAERAVRRMAAAETADRQVSDILAKLHTARNALAGGTGPITFRQAAVAWKLESYAPERARVAIWNVGVLSRHDVAPPQAGWAISTFDLVWERGDWRIERETIVPGPAPILNDSAAPATTAQLVASLDGFTDFAGLR